MNTPNAYHRIADIYDAYVQVDFDIPFFLQEAKRCEGEVLELMSGTGRVSVPLIEAGVRLTCVDISAGMLERLHEKLAAGGLSAQVVQADVCELDLKKRFDLIFIPFHAFAEIVSPEARGEALRRIYAHLSENGHFILTLHNPRVRRKSVDGQLRLWKNCPFPDGRQLLFWGLENFEPTGNIVQILEFFEEYGPDGVLQSKRLLEARFCLLSKTELESQAEAAGFKILSLYGNYADAPFQDEGSPFMIWIMGRK